eukprot:jgi/Tetstr1/438069/TSEL_026694.t1
MEEDDRTGSRSGSGSGNEEGSGKPAPPRYHPKNPNEQGSGDRDESPPGHFGVDVSSSHQTFWAPGTDGTGSGGSGGTGGGSGGSLAAPPLPTVLLPPAVTEGAPHAVLKTPSTTRPSSADLSNRKYMKPPPKRKGAAQALIWNFMIPYSSADGQRTVECCILVPCKTTDGVRKCGATFKHKMGGSTTNLLKHLRRRHPDEANRCSEERGQQGLGVGTSDGGAMPRATDQGGEGAHGNPSSEIWDGGDAARAFSLYCAVDLQPPTVSADVGLMQHLHVRRFSPQPADRDMFQANVAAERANLSRYIVQLLARQRSSVSAGPFCSLQLSVWKGPEANPSAFAVATVTFVTPSFELRRLGLDVHDFPLGFTATQVAAWVKRITAEYFDGLAPSEVYVACTIGGGTQLEGAMEELSVPYLNCKLTKLLHAVEDGILVTVHHAPGQSSTMARLLRKARDVSGAITRPARGNPGLAVLQGAIGKDFLGCPGNPNSLRSVLHLFITLLRRRAQITEYMRSAGTHSPFSITQTEWSMFCDVVGVLEACIEVERSVPPNTDVDGVMPLTSMLVLLQELQDYMSDGMLFVPEIDSDMDSHRVEKAVSALDPGLQALRSNILNKLKGGEIGRMAGRIERLAAVLDVSQKGVLLTEEEEGRAWEELAAEHRRASYSRAKSSAVRGNLDEASSSGASSSSASTHVKRKWGGALQARKKQRWMASIAQQLESTTPPAEIEAFRTMLLLTHGVPDPLAWWSGRDNTSSNATGPRVAQLPLLSQLFAQYHGVDSCSVQAQSLLGDVGYRITGLRHVMMSMCIEDMMFLRLNRGIIDEAAAAQPPSQDS